jgi:transaldolase
MVKTIRDMYDIHGIKTEIISASISSPYYVIECAKAGSHICTIPYGVMNTMLGHPSSDRVREGFANAWAEYKKEQGLE